MKPGCNYIAVDICQRLRVLLGLIGFPSFKQQDGAIFIFAEPACQNAPC